MLIHLQVNLRLGGVCITGRRGTAKSILCRAIHAYMPDIEVKLY